VNGYLKQQGWGAEMGYPGIVLDNTGDVIKGYVFSSDKLDSHWDRLDNFEGKEYKRILIKVKTKNKMEVEAYIYILRES
jgi:gamma-glutamylcyclotransferase (GGCT)/AIG2-like uncharacterized protein YtfP